jgi:hypothetical protein
VRRLVVAAPPDAGRVPCAPLRTAHDWRVGSLAFASWELTPRLELEVNAGALAGVRSGPGGLDIVLATALTGQQLLGPIGAFTEVFAEGEPNLASGTALLGSGLLVALARDVQLDGGAYVGLAGAAAPLTPFVGVSLRR